MTALLAVACGREGRSGSPPPRLAVPTCAGADAIDFECYRNRYRRLTAVAGPRAAIRDLTRRAQRVAYLRAACHRLMYGIGHSAGARAGLGAFQQGDESCSSGFYHGVVEAVMAPARAA